jgi:hypothetical protein
MAELSEDASMVGRGVGTDQLDHEDGDGDDNDDDDDDDDDDDHDGRTPNGSESTGRWTRLEHELFVDALKKYGKVSEGVLLP